MARRSDEELARILQERSPEELSLEEIRQIGKRLRRSPALREALADRLAMEEWLNAALGKAPVEVGRIIKEAKGGRGRGLPLSSRLAILLIAALISAALILALVIHAPEPGAPRPRPPVAAVEPAPGEPRPEAAATRPLGAEEKEGERAAEEIGDEPAKAPEAKAIAMGPPLGPILEAEKSSRGSVSIDGNASIEAKAFGFQEEGAPDQEGLKRWLSQVAGSESRIFEERRGDLTLAAFEGLLALAPPWQADAALRLWLLDQEGLQIHLWNGREGVTLRCHDRRGGWAAFSAHRKDDLPRPTSLGLVATDDGRGLRGGPSWIEIRHHEGALWMCRGDLVLLSAPLASPPGPVFLEGRAKVLGISFQRAGPLPAPPRDSGPIVLDGKSPAALSWKCECPQGSRLDHLPEGAIELSAEKSQAPSWASVPIGRTGLFEACFLVEEASPGTGVFLGDVEGRPIHRLGFFRDAASGRTTFGFLRQGEEKTDASHDPARGPIPLAGKRQWLRLVLGPGNLKCSASGDGGRWSRAIEPLREAKGLAPFASLGAYCLKSDGKRSIRIGRLEVRELDAIAALAPPGAVAAAPPLEGAEDPGSWLEAALRSQPRDLDPAAWRRACAIRALAAGPPLALGEDLLSSLLEDALREKSPLDGRLRLLDQAALLADAWEKDRALRFTRFHERLGRVLLAEGSLRPFSAVHPSLLEIPLVTSEPIDAFPEELAEREVLELVHAGAWSELLETSRRMRFFSQPADPWMDPRAERSEIRLMADWAGALALRNLPEERGVRLPAMPVAWRHPLMEELSKEGYNLLAEFEAAVGSESYSAACQIITSSSLQAVSGFLPDSRDPGLFVSFPGAVALAMRDSPALRRTMTGEFGPLGLIRVRQAAAQGDTAAIEAATVQFFGTEAASEARSWLGDRALVSGDFLIAQDHYEEALRDAPAERLGQISARLRLAAAMVGREAGDPPAGPVELNGARIAPAEFEKVVREMRERSKGASPAPRAGEIAEGPPGAPPPRGYAVRSSLKKKEPEAVANDAPEIPYRAVDWAGLQISAVFAGNLLLVSNRFQLTAFDLASGAEAWRYSLGGDLGDAHRWHLVPMRPVVIGERVCARLLAKDGPELACLELSGGKPLWRSRPGDHVASDPLPHEDRLFALIATRREERSLELHLASYDPLTGESPPPRLLARWKDVWSRQIPCAAAASSGRIVACAGGTVLCCDFLGRPLWLKRQTWLPRKESLTTARRGPPLIAGGSVFASQPGVDSVERLDLGSGRERWLRPVEGIRRVVALEGKALIVQTRGGLLALDGESGNLLWERDIPRLLEVELHGGPAGLLATALEPEPEDVKRPVLLWIDPGSGAETARSPVSRLSGREIKFGPVAARGERLFAFTGAGDREQRREIVELVPEGRALPGWPGASALDAWTGRLDPDSRGAVGSVLPGWALIALPGGPAAGPRAEPLGEEAVLVSRRPAVLAREVSIPAGSRAKLLIECGHEPQGSWKLRVEAGPQTLLEETVDAKTASGGWLTREVDLSSLAGSRSAWLLVKELAAADAPARAILKRLEVKAER